MSWLLEAMKDVISCDKLRGGANNRYIRRFPNGATQSFDCIARTQGTETSKYLEEEKTIVISLVVASEREIAQTYYVSA